MEFVMPVPPSLNDYWRSASCPGRGVIVYLSAKGRAYKAGIGAALRQYKLVVVRPPLQVKLELVWYRQRRQGDVDNRLKCIEDSLEGIAYVDDAQVKDVRIRREEDPGNPRVFVWLEVLAAEPVARRTKPKQKRLHD